MQSFYCSSGILISLHVFTVVSYVKVLKMSEPGPVKYNAVLYHRKFNSVGCCLQVEPVMSTDVIDACSTEQNSDSLQPFDDANNTVPYCSDEVESIALLSSPLLMSDDDDDDRRSTGNHIENIIGMLQADETRSPVHGMNEKRMVDKSTETSATWDLDDVDEWLREEQCEVALTSSSFTDIYQPSAEPLYGKPVESLQPLAVTSSVCVDSDNSASFTSSCQYFTQSDVELASCLTEMHQPSISQPSLMLLGGNLTESAPPPAVTSSNSESFQNNVSFTSRCQYYGDMGKYSVIVCKHSTVYSAVVQGSSI